MKRNTLIVSVTVAAVLAGGFAATTLTGPDTADAGQTQARLPTATEPIVQGDLVSSTSVDGTLGYAKQRKINSGTGGTLTWVGASGAEVERNGKLYAVDGTPVRLWFGTEPMYRKLKNGDTGTDVKQVKQNLIALGYGAGLAADDTFTDGTTKGVKRWQKDHGLKQTGEIGPETIAFAPGPVRVASAEASVGDRTAPGQQVLTTTSADRVVRLKVKVSQAALAKPDSKVEVQLPDNTTTSGTVASVGAVAKSGDSPDDRTPRIDVTVTFDDPEKVSGIDQAPATVKLTGQTRKNVLSVPVGALLALKDGSFGVQVVDGGQVREVKVTLGMFAQGRVEITGDGLRAGMRVGVPSV
ncbi:peptidoglycan-binding protein [Streptomyces sp. TRM64462]|uniref:peptidoglycan-binding protein n=1 Tax=Streptomyces sp. TRM64462 TaxID=2741726 RepID=UPI001586715A|nr:peptidoglycan-binding protein [Streptomyces sp. TRM64462]